MQSDDTALSDALGYTFREEHLLSRALTHRSFNTNHNERLEFLGDAILGFVIAEALYRQFPEANEGELTRLRAHLVRGESLAELAISLSLSDYLKLGPGELKSGAFKRESILEDAFEAIIGAIYLDGGINAATKVISQLFDAKCKTLSLTDTKRDAKSQLQELLQAHGLALPIYTLVKTHGKEHNQTFYVRCEIHDLTLCTNGKAKSRKIAEQDAATLALLQAKTKLKST